MHSRLFHALAVASVTLIPCVAAAAPAAQPALQEIGSVSVDAGRGAGLRHSDVSTTIITRKEIEAAPETSLDQLLNRVPGIYTPMVPAAALHPTAQIVSVRGFGNAFGVKTLVLVDGIPFNDGFFRTIDWAALPLSSIERVEVVRGGGATSLWGNLALGGVINIVTRRPRAGEQNFGLSYGSYNTKTIDAAQTLLATSRFAMRASASAATTGGYALTPAQFRGPGAGQTALVANTASLQTRYEPNARLKTQLALTANGANQSGLTWTAAGNQWRHVNIRAGGDYSVGRGIVHSDLWYDNGLFATQNVNNPGYTLAAPATGTPFVSQRENLIYQTTGASLSYRRGQFITGADYRRIDAKDGNRFFNAQSAETAAFATTGSHRFYGLFAQNVFPLGKLPAEATLGIRQDFWQTSDGSLRGTTATGAANQQFASTYFSRFDPRAGVTYHLNRQLDARAVVYRNFSAPGMNQMYRSYASGTSFNAASPQLVPETNTGSEYGLTYATGKIHAEATIFDNRIRDYIDYPSICTTASTCAAPSADSGLAGVTTVRQYLNVGDAHIRGLEIIGKAALSKAVDVRAGFTRTQAFLTSTAFPAIDPLNAQIGQNPSYVLTAGVDWRPAPRISLALDARSFPGYWYNTAHTISNDGATVVNFGGQYAFDDHTHGYFSVQNLGRKTYNDQGANPPSGAPVIGQPFTVVAGIRTSR